MADITDIKSIVYTEKVLGIENDNLVVIKTAPKMNKNGIREVFKEYFGVNPIKINSLRQSGKVKKFKGTTGRRPDFKKFYVQLPEGSKIASLEV